MYFLSLRAKRSNLFMAYLRDYFVALLLAMTDLSYFATVPINSEECGFFTVLRDSDNRYKNILSPE